MAINFELLDLRAFLAVLDLGSFRKAALRLHLSQPALSRRIQSLEGALGIPLIERTTRHVAATAAGRDFEPHARRWIDELEASVSMVSGAGVTHFGQVTIACIPTAAFYFLPRIVHKFAEKYPHVRFRILDMSANENLQSVARGDVEFGINFMGTSAGDLTFTPLIDDPFVLACRRDHPLARKRSIRWTELQGQQLIGVSRTSGNRILLDNMMARENIDLTWFYEVNHLATSLGLVEAGLGASVLPRLAMPVDDHPVLVAKKLIEPNLSRTIGLVERRSAQLSAPARLFREMLVGTAARRPA